MRFENYQIALEFYISIRNCNKVLWKGKNKDKYKIIKDKKNSNFWDNYFENPLVKKY